MAIGDNIRNLLTGGVLSKPQDDKAVGALGNETAAYSGIQNPDLQPVSLATDQYVGDVNAPQLADPASVSYNPADVSLATASQQGDSGMNNISTDPRLADNQMASIAGLNQLAQQGGMNSQDRANLANIENQTSQADRGRRDAILQNQEARGMGGSGASLLAQLASSQGATDQQSQQGLSVAGMAQQRALDAMMQSGQLSGQVRGQQFGEQAQKAAAQDAINKFNAQNSTAVNQTNAAATTANNQTTAAANLGAQKFNTDAGINVHTGNANRTVQVGEHNQDVSQATHNAAVGQHNQGTLYNAGIPQQQFEDSIQRAHGLASGDQNTADYWDKQSGGTRKAYGNAMGSLGGLASSANAGTGLFSGTGALGSMFGGGAGAAAAGGAGGAGASSLGAAGGGAGAAGLGSSGSATGDYLGGASSTGDYLGGASAGGGAGGGAGSYGVLASDAAPAAEAFWKGGLVPGMSSTSGNSPMNDTVSAKLSPGEMVVPHSLMGTPEAQSLAGKLGHSTAPNQFNMESFLSAIKNAHRKKSAFAGTPTPASAHIAALNTLAGNKV